MYPLSDSQLTRHVKIKQSKSLFFNILFKFVLVILLIIFYSSKCPLYEKFQGDEQLVNYLKKNHLSKMKDYVSGIRLGPGCQVENSPGQWGTEWTAIYKDSNSKKYSEIVEKKGWKFPVLTDREKSIFKALNVTNNPYTIGYI